MGYNIAFKTSTLKNLIVSDRDKKTKIGGVNAIPIVTIITHYTSVILVKQSEIYKQGLNNIKIPSHQYTETQNFLKKMLLANEEAQPKWEEAKVLVTPHIECMLDI